LPKAKGGEFPTPETYLLFGETALPLARIEIEMTMILFHSGCPPHPEWSILFLSPAIQFLPEKLYGEMNVR